MPSHAHEETLKVFSRRPDFIRKILEIPDDHEIKEGDRHVKPPVDRTTDGVRLIYGPESPYTKKRPLERVVIVEAQYSPATLKRLGWLGYSVDLRRQYRKENPKVIVLIITVTYAMERWCHAEIERARREGYTFPHHIIGPSGFSKPVPLARAKDDPDKTILSAIHHMSTPGPKADNLRVMCNLLVLANGKYEETCYNLLNGGFFTDADRDNLEKYMSTKTQVKDGPFDRLVWQRAGKMLREAEAKVEAAKAEGKAEGIAEGKAEGIAEGKAEGIAEGKAEGIAEGKAEGIAEGVAKETARIVEAIRRAVEARGWTLDEAQQAALKQRDILALALCLGQVATAPSLEAVLSALRAGLSGRPPARGRRPPRPGEPRSPRAGWRRSARGLRRR